MVRWRPLTRSRCALLMMLSEGLLNKQIATSSAFGSDREGPRFGHSAEARRREPPQAVIARRQDRNRLLVARPPRRRLNCRPPPRSGGHTPSSYKGLLIGLTDFFFFAQWSAGIMGPRFRGDTETLLRRATRITRHCASSARSAAG